MRPSVSKQQFFVVERIFWAHFLTRMEFPNFLGGERFPAEKFQKIHFGQTQ